MNGIVGQNLFVAQPFGMMAMRVVVVAFKPNAVLGAATFGLFLFFLLDNDRWGHGLCYWFGRHHH